MKTINFITGLPRAGSTLICDVLKQNPDIYAEAVSSLSSLVAAIHANWNLFSTDRDAADEISKLGVITGVLSGYYSHVNKPFIFDASRQWVSQIGLLESVLQKKVKILVMVRNPAEILASFEKLKINNPTYFMPADQTLRETSTVASRAYFYAGPTGSMGLTYALIKDAITMGYLDRLLFVDYGRYCNTPKAQTKRIYDFFEIPHFDHDFSNIEKSGYYPSGFPNLHKTKTKLEKTTINCVEYLGLDLYQQYNREIFWDAWI